MNALLIKGRQNERTLPPCILEVDVHGIGKGFRRLSVGKLFSLPFPIHLPAAHNEVGILHASGSVLIRIDLGFLIPPRWRLFFQDKPLLAHACIQAAFWCIKQAPKARQGT